MTLGRCAPTSELACDPKPPFQKSFGQYGPVIVQLRHNTAGFFPIENDWLWQLTILLVGAEIICIFVLNFENSCYFVTPLQIRHHQLSGGGFGLAVLCATKANPISGRWVCCVFFVRHQNAWGHHYAEVQKNHMVWLKVKNCYTLINRKYSLYNVGFISKKGKSDVSNRKKLSLRHQVGSTKTQNQKDTLQNLQTLQKLDEWSRFRSIFFKETIPPHPHLSLGTLAWCTPMSWAVVSFFSVQALTSLWMYLLALILPS